MTIAAYSELYLRDNRARAWTDQLLFALRRWATLVLAVTAVFGQTVLNDPKKIADAQKLLDTLSGDQLRCEVSPRKPHFIYSLRVQAGYVAHIPLTQSQVQGQKWIVLARLTSKEASPVYLSDIVQFPPGGNSEHEAQLEGSYWLGKGLYSVKFLMFNDRGDVCRQEWQIDARLNSGVSNFKPVLPPGTVSGNSLKESIPPAAAKPVGRLTILLHAASLLQKETSLLDLDKAMFLDAMVALLEEMPARSVRLVAFNLEQQREIYRKDGFTFAELPELARALDVVQPATVDYSVLQNPNGTVHHMQNLVSQEIHASEPSNAVVFLGPRSIYKDKPTSSFGLPPGGKQQFFYLLWEQPPKGSGLTFGPGQQGLQGATIKGVPPFAGMTGPGSSVYDWPARINYGPNNGPDSIEYTVHKLGGKTMKVDSVPTFAGAVTEIARLSGMKQ